MTGWKLELMGSISPSPMGAVLVACWLERKPEAEDCSIPPEQIRKRARIVHRADGDHVQFGVKAERAIVHQPDLESKRN